MFSSLIDFVGYISFVLGNSFSFLRMILPLNQVFVPFLFKFFYSFTSTDRLRDAKTGRFIKREMANEDSRLENTMKSELQEMKWIFLEIMERMTSLNIKVQMLKTN